MLNSLANTNQKKYITFVVLKIKLKPCLGSFVLMSPFAMWKSRVPDSSFGMLTAMGPFWTLNTRRTRKKLNSCCMHKYQPLTGQPFCESLEEGLFVSDEHAEVLDQQLELSNQDGALTGPINVVLRGSELRATA